MKKIIFFGIALIGMTVNAQMLPASVSKQAKTEAKTATAASSTIKKVNKGAKKVETTAEDASKYSNNKLIGKTKGGSKKVKDATAN